MTASWDDVQQQHADVPGRGGVEARRTAYGPFFLRFGRDVTIGPGCRFHRPDRICLDDGACISEGAVVEGEGGVYIGRHVYVGPACRIYSSRHELASAGDPTADPGVPRGTWIGHWCRITAGGTLHPGVRLGCESVVGADTVVTAADYPDSSRLLGDPAELLAPGPQEACLFEEAPEIALVVPGVGPYREAAEQLTGVLGLPLVAVLADGQPAPSSVHTIVACGLAEGRPGTPDRTVWRLAPGTSQTDGTLRVSLPDGGEETLCGSRTDSVVCSFTDSDDEAQNRARATLFYALERLRKHTGPLSADDLAEWLLYLLMVARERRSRESPSTDAVCEALVARTVQAGVTLPKPLSRLLSRLDRDVLSRAIVALCPQLSGARAWRQILDTGADLPETALAALLRHPVLAPGAVEAAGVEGTDAFQALRRAVEPHGADARRAASLGLAAMMAGQTAVVEQVASTLLAPDWLGRTGVCVRNAPGSVSFCYSPLLAAFLVQRARNADPSFAADVEHDVTHTMSWSLFRDRHSPWQVRHNRRPKGALVHAGRRLISESLLSNWRRSVTAPQLGGRQIKLDTSNYTVTAGTIEDLWLSIFRHIQHEAGRPLLRVKPWPFGYPAAISLRYDCDRKISTERFQEIADIQRELFNGPCASWYVFEEESRQDEWQSLVPVYQQESGIHALSVTAACRDRGVTFHSGPTSDYWRAAETVAELSRRGAAYGEMLATQLSTPRPGLVDQDGGENAPDPRTDTWLLPLHFPLEGSTTDTTLAYFDRLLEHFSRLIGRGGHVIIGSHPDLDQGKLRRLAERESLGDLWPTTAMGAVERCRSLFGHGLLRIVRRDPGGQLYLVSHHNVCDVHVEIDFPDAAAPDAACLQLKAGVPTKLPGMTSQAGPAPPRRSRFTSEQKPPAWYDDVYRDSDEYKQHYSKSVYYPVWTVLIDRVRRHGPRGILEVGCGAGQLAHAITEAHAPGAYHGFDVSPEAVALARARCPGLRFDVGDAVATRLFDTVDYDMVIATEVLEHVREDRLILRSIRSGARVLATVPGFDAAGHVRYFGSEAEVAERYRDEFAELSIVPVRLRERGTSVYLIDGVRSWSGVQRSTEPEGN